MGVTDGGHLSGVAGRSTDALRGLFDRHAAAVYGLARTLLRSDQAAEEVTEEVFVQMWRNGTALGDGADVRLGLLDLGWQRCATRATSGEPIARPTREQQAVLLLALSGSSLERVAAVMGAERGDVAAWVRSGLASVVPLLRTTPSPRGTLDGDRPGPSGFDRTSNRSGPG